MKQESENNAPVKTRTERKARAWRVFLIVVISLTVGFGLYSFNALRLLGNALPMPFGVGVSVVLSGSMEPDLNVNDLVFLREAESYQPGEIVVYQDGRTLVIHRLLAIDGETAVTKGDANNRADDPIPVSAIKGKLVAAIPWLGVPVRFLKSPAGFVLVLLIAVYLFIRSGRKERASANAETEAILREIQYLRGQLTEGADEKKPDNDANGKTDGDT